MYTRAVILYSSFFIVYSNNCYWNRQCSYKYFGSKTIYDEVRGDIRDTVELKGCEPVNVWAMIRHGIRHPSSNNLLAMQQAADLKDLIIRRYLEGHGTICAQDISNLQKWSWPDTISSTTAYLLTSEGYQELRELGARYHDYFRILLQQVDRYRFKPSFEHRAIQSGKAFVEGLAQRYFNFELANATDVDELLRPYNYCMKHNVEVYNGLRSTMEVDRYYETPEFRKVIENVQKRTGIDEILSPTNILGFYDLCRFFRAYSVISSSPWCALFSDDDLAVLEYPNDLKHYYRNGYGFFINGKLAGPVLGDLLENFEASIKQSTKSFTAYFSHDSTLQMMYVALGLFRDYPALSGFERIPDRKWRSSLMTPFAANFEAVLHKCVNETGTTNYQVQFFINEKEFHLCDSRTCSWEEFMERFSKFRNSNLEVCNIHGNGTSLKSIAVEI